MLEYIYPRTSNNHIINILEEEKLKEHQEKCYNFIHIGLIQVVVKPNFRLGINISIFMILRDTRFKKFRDSLIAILKSNCHDGLVFFNCYPNFSMSLKNEYTSETLTLYIKTPKVIIDEKYYPFDVIYIIYYKITRINYNFTARRESSKDETIIIHTNLRRSFIQTPKKLQHEKLMKNIPEEWILEDINKEKNTPRHSIDHSVINEEVIRINNNRPNITTPYINKDFNAEYNTGLRKWYFTKYFGKKTIETRKEFYDYLTKNKINLYFFDWFKNYFQDFKKEFCPLIESQYPQKETIKLQFQSPDVIKLRTNVKADIEELKEKLKSISQEKTVINIIEINKMTYKNQYYPKLRNYYQRPISTDVSLEGRIQLVQNSFIGSDL
ncbi:hypothetical protein HN51_017843, partial [Arachis hypogaea]